MRAHRLRWLVSAALTVVIALAALAPAGTTARPGPGHRTAASDASAAPSASPSPSPSAAPAGCPDLAGGHVALATIIAAGPARMIECLAAAGTTQVEFDAFFPAGRQMGCGGMGGVAVHPFWFGVALGGVDPVTGEIQPNESCAEGMRVTTGPEPAGLSEEAVAAWLAANQLDLRLPPGMGGCDTTIVPRFGCPAAFRYAGQVLHVTAHYRDPMAQTCEAWYASGDGTVREQLPRADARTWCDRQLVVESFLVTQPGVCPSTPYTVLQFSHFTAKQLLACFGSRDISVVAFVPSGTPDVRTWDRWTGTPGWLVDDGWMGLFLAGDYAYGAPDDWRIRIPPRLGECRFTSADSSCPFEPYGGSWVRMIGHFSDRLYTACRAAWDSPEPKPAWFTPSSVRAYCRQQFVLAARPVATLRPAKP